MHLGKNPQILTDAITKVQKLNTAQQLTTTILPSSAVNLMSKEEDQCFQCQEPGHIATHFPQSDVPKAPTKYLLPEHG